MPRYIDIEPIEKAAHDYGYLVVSIALINEQPTADVVEVVRCKDCKHRPTDTGGHNYGHEMEFPDYVCPCQVEDQWYSWMPKGNWFCANGERREEE